MLAHSQLFVVVAHRLCNGFVWGDVSNSTGVNLAESEAMQNENKA